MAKVTITLEDSKTGALDLKIESDPPFNAEGVDNTTAQNAGLIAAETIVKMLGGNMDEMEYLDDEEEN